MKKILLVFFVIIVAATFSYWGNKVSETEIISTFFLIFFIVIFYLVATKIFNLNEFQMFVWFLIIISIILFILNSYF